MEPVQIYGSTDLNGEPVVLGAIAQVREGEDGRVYVLDAGFKQIVVYNADGTILRILRGGHGEGPGEFMHPIGMSLGPQGTIAVFDYQLNRVTVFDSLGVVRETFQTPRARDILLTDQHILGTAMPGREAVIWALDRRDHSVARRIPVNPEQTAWLPSGVVARLGRKWDGTPLLAHQRPGLWLDDPLEAVRFGGTELLPGQRFRDYEGIPTPPADALGIGQFVDGTVVIPYLLRDLSTPEASPDIRYYVAALDENGAVLGQAKLPPITAFSTA